MSDFTYVNYQSIIASGSWSRRVFAHVWWRLAAADRRWCPPLYPRLRRGLNPTTAPYLVRLATAPLHMEALPLRRKTGPATRAPSEWAVAGNVLEVPLAAAVLTVDPRRQERAGYLVWPQVRNDREIYGRFLEALWEPLLKQGVTSLIGPVGLSPHLGSGLLVDEWAAMPPAHTGYNPPYLPELIGARPDVLATSRLWHLPLPAEIPPATGPAQFQPFEPRRLVADLLPLLTAATASPHFAAVDADEAAFLLRWLDPATLAGWLALVDGEPAGFVLLQPDQSARLRLVNGGRGWLRWLWWQAIKNRPAGRGRLLFGGVLPAFRRRGVGRQLLRQAVVHAQAQGWQSLMVGPIDETNETAVALLTAFEARPRQTYQLRQWRY